MYTSPLVDTLSSPTSYQKSPNNRNFYISPTYQSSIFNHTQTFTPAARETRHASNQASSTYRETTDNVNKGNARVVFDVRRIITEDFQKDLAKIEKKRQENIQRKKPTEEDIRSFEASQNEYQKLMTRRKTEIQTEKINYRNDLIRQMEERSRRRTLELEETGETSQRRFGLSMSMNASPARDLYPSVGKGSRSRERESSLEKTEESGVVKVVKRGQKKVNEYNSKGSERSKEVKRNQLPYSSGYVVAQTVRGQGSLERILSKAMKSPKGNSTERRPVLEKDRSPSSELTLPMKSKAEKPTQMRVQSATQIGQRNLSGEKKAPVVNKKQEKKGISPGFNPLLKDKPVTVKKETRMRRGAANRDENEIEEVKPERQLQFDREAVDYMRNKKLEQISRLTGSVGKQSEMLLDVIDEDPSLQLNDEEFEEEQMNISIKRTVKDHDDEDSHAPRIMDLKGFFKSKINGNELRALESDRTDRTGDNPDSQSRRGSNSERSEQKDILEALMEKRKDLLNYLRGLKGKLSQSANKREIEKEYGSNEKEKGKSSSKGAKPKDKTGGIDWMRENMTAKQKLLQQGRSTTVKPINELIMAQIFERQRASKDERKVEASAETDYEKKSEKYKGYEPSQGSTDVFSKQMKILQQYKRNMKFYGYPENYSSAGSKM